METQNKSQQLQQVTENLQGPWPLSLNYVKNLGWKADEIQIYQQQYKSPAIRELKMDVIRAGIKLILVNCHIITGCIIPDSAEIREMTYQKLEKSFAESEAYSSLNLDEIETAFRMNAAGQIGERVKHWQNNFNLEYFGQVMDGYLEKRAQVRQKMLVVLPPPESPVDLPDWKAITENCYQEFLTGNFNIRLWPWQCHNELVKIGWIHPDAYIDFKEQAFLFLKNEKTILYKKAVELGQHSLGAIMLKEMENYYETTAGELAVKETSMILTMMALFKMARIQLREHLFTKIQTPADANR